MADAPAPLSNMVCGLPTAVSVMLIAAVRALVAVGLNDTLIVQLALGANDVPHVCVCEKSPGSGPAIAIALMSKMLVPTLLRVIACAPLLEPTTTVPKFKPEGDTFAAVPLPLNATVCGLPAALSLRLSAAVRVPLAVGLKVTVIVQLALAPNELPHVCVCK